MSETISPMGQVPKPLKRELHAALMEEVARHREAIPCLQPSRGIDWLDPHPGTQQAAAELCHGCPALQVCKRYAATTRKAPGVWAGLTEADRERRRAEYRARRNRKQAGEASTRQTTKQPATTHSDGQESAA